MNKDNIVRRRAQYVVTGDHILYRYRSGTVTFTVLSADTCRDGPVSNRVTRKLTCSNGAVEKVIVVPLGYSISVRTDMKDRNNSAITIRQEKELIT